MASNKRGTGKQAKRKPVLRDALTGEPIDPKRAVAFIRWRDYDASRPEGARADPPLTLNRSETDFGGLGGAQYSGDFARYLAPVLPREVAEEKARWLAWWDVDYVLGRMRARMGKATIDAVLAVERDGLPLRAVAIAYGHSEPWLCRMIGRSRKLSHSYFVYKVHRDAGRS